MKNLSLISICLFLVATGLAQTKSISLSDYSSLDAATGVSIILHEGTPKADIEVTKGDIEDLVVEVKGSTLVIKFKNKVMSWNNGGNKARIDLYGKNLRRIEASAGANVESDYTLTAKKFTADASSGASISVDVECTTLDAEISSGASIVIEGTTDDLEVDASSGASYNGIRMIAKDASAEASSGASIKLWAKESIEANASSGGSIKYKGDPTNKDISKDKWSGGSIKRM